MTIEPPPPRSRTSGRSCSLACATFLNVMSWRSKNRQIIDGDTFSPRVRSKRAQIRPASGQARAGEGAKGSPHAPPRAANACAAHRQRRIAAALAQCRHPPDRAGKLTPNRRAAARQLMPSSPTAETTRLRKSTDKGPISRRLRLVRSKSDFIKFGNPKQFNARKASSDKRATSRFCSITAG